MASMFRAVKFETMEDIEAKFMHKKIHAELKAKQTLHGELTNNANIDQLIMDLNGDNSSAQGNNSNANTTAQDKSKEQSAKEKALKINKDKNTPIDSKLLQQASVQAAMSEGKKKKKGDGKLANMEDEEGGVGSINDRVFVCLGKLKETGQAHSWVMTLNKMYDEITLWDVNLPHKYVNPALKLISLIFRYLLEGSMKERKRICKAT